MTLSDVAGRLLLGYVRGSLGRDAADEAAFLSRCSADEPLPTAEPALSPVSTKVGGARTFLARATI
jgi:hypothetical protein